MQKLGVALGLKVSVSGHVLRGDAPDQIVRVGVQAVAEGGRQPLADRDLGSQKILQEYRGGRAVAGPDVRKPEGIRAFLGMMVDNDVEGNGQLRLEKVGLGVDEGEFRVFVPGNFVLDGEGNLQFAGEKLVLLALYGFQRYDLHAAHKVFYKLPQGPGRGKGVRIRLAVHQNGKLVVLPEKTLQPGDLPFGAVADQHRAKL